MMSHSPISISKITSNEISKFKELLSIFNNVFEMKDISTPNTSHLIELLNSDTLDVFLAEFQGKVIGGLTVYVLKQYYSTRPLAYVYDFAIDYNFQRQGYGKILLDEVNIYYKHKGFEELYVQADIEDTNALDFYRSSCPTKESKVIQFSFSYS